MVDYHLNGIGGGGGAKALYIYFQTDELEAKAVKMQFWNGDKLGPSYNQ